MHCVMRRCMLKGRTAVHLLLQSSRKRTLTGRHRQIGIRCCSLRLILWKATTPLRWLQRLQQGFST